MYVISDSVVFKLALLSVASALFVPESFAATNAAADHHHIRRASDANVHMMEVSTAHRAAPTIAPIDDAKADEGAPRRFDNVAMISTTSPYSVAMPPLDVSPAEELQSNSTQTKAGYGLPLPEPDGWTAVLATVALGLFFFLRRIV